MSKYIPFEIQEDILKRLPVKPLIQFRSVSKTWKGLIDSPNFIVSYGVRDPPQPSDRFILSYQVPLRPYLDSLVYSDGHREVRYLTFVDNDDGHIFVQQDLVPTIPDLVKKLVPHSIKVVGSSHGLLCLTGCHNCFGIDLYILWNPSVSKSIGIQVPNPYRYDDDDIIGFGVCPVTFDPIIINIRCIDNQWRITDIPWKVQVFTLSTGNWSMLCTNLPHELIGLNGPQVVIDRFIYWVASSIHEDGRELYVILSFDLTAKEFKEFNLTDNLTKRLQRIPSISKLRESLVLLAYHKEFEEGLYSLWMMMEEGGSRSFTKLYNIHYLDSVNHILGFRKSGEVMMETQKVCENAKLEIYKPSCKSTDNLGVVGEWYTFFMCSYMETLFLLNESDGYIYRL